MDDGKRKRFYAIRVRFPAELWERLSAAAGESGRPVDKEVLDALRRHCDERERRRKAVPAHETPPLTPLTEVRPALDSRA